MVGAQTSRGSESGWVDTLGPGGYGTGYSNRKIFVQSDLAKRLQPPSYPKPKPPARPYVALPSSSRGIWLWRLAALVLLLPSLYVALIGIAIFMAQFLYDRREYTLLKDYGLTNAANRANPASQYLLAVGFIVVAMLLLLPMIAIMRWPLRSRKRERYALWRNLVDAANREYEPRATSRRAPKLHVAAREGHRNVARFIRMHTRHDRLLATRWTARLYRGYGRISVGVHTVIVLAPNGTGLPLT